jgi:GDP-L-fucose synthase
LGWNFDEEINYNNNISVENILNKLGAFKDKVVLWGNGSVYRELMLSDDTADCCVYLMENKNYKEIGEFVNITGGTDIQLKNLFEIIKKIVGFEGKIEYDTTKPNGTPKRLLDNTKLKNLGWQPKFTLEEGIKLFYNWYIEKINRDLL